MERAMPPLRLLAAALVLLWAAPALAIPFVEVDTDPLAPGVQASRTVAPGESFDVDIVITVDALAPLNAFELDLLFDASVLSALAVADGGFLAAPRFVIEADVAAPDVNLAIFTLGPGAVTGFGVLGSIHFEAAAAGTSALALANVKLSGPFAGPIPALLVDGSIEVREPGPQPVPEPRAALLFGLGFAFVARRLRRPRSH
jgi:hypothetical protein